MTEWFFVEPEMVLLRHRTEKPLEAPLFLRVQVEMQCFKWKKRTKSTFWLTLRMNFLHPQFTLSYFCISYILLSSFTVHKLSLSCVFRLLKHSWSVCFLTPISVPFMQRGWLCFHETYNSPGESEVLKTCEVGHSLSLFLSVFVRFKEYLYRQQCMDTFYIWWHVICFQSSNQMFKRLHICSQRNQMFIVVRWWT